VPAGGSETSGMAAFTMLVIGSAPVVERRA
jgi:hypothetical protein